MFLILFSLQLSYSTRHGVGTWLSLNTCELTRQINVGLHLTLVGKQFSLLLRKKTA